MFRIIITYEISFFIFWNILYYSNSGIENWFEEKILTAIFVFLSTMALGFTVVYIVYEGSCVLYWCYMFCVCFVYVYVRSAVQVCIRFMYALCVLHNVLCVLYVFYMVDRCLHVLHMLHMFMYVFTYFAYTC